MIRSIADAAHPGSRAPTLIVMLPPAYSGPEDFVRAGFVAAARERRLEVDLAFAALELRHVADRAALTELWQELLSPARAEGRAVWLGGISFGAFLALSCAERHPGELAGVCVLAPWLGTHLITGEIARASDVQAWEAGEPAEDDEERRVWRFIKTHASRALPIHLGIGSDDRFAGRHRLMAAALGPDAVDIVPGGHDWPTWRRLWERFLDLRLAGDFAAARV
jgi:pimeloyl-ACP methyl ester carboxylesterase